MAKRKKKSGSGGLIKLLVALLFVVAVGAFVIMRSSNEIANANPIGQPFPSVIGATLEEEETKIPEDFAGESVVLLIGYEQEAQFDIDRWIMGLIQTEAPIRIVEVPTIPGLMPSMASNYIDEGMRSGIPKEDWGSVITLYGKAARPVATLTGTEEGQLARVVVLDPTGAIVWFDDKGYSARKAMEVAEVATQRWEYDD